MEPSNSQAPRTMSTWSVLTVPPVSTLEAVLTEQVRQQGEPTPVPLTPSDPTSPEFKYTDPQKGRVLIEFLAKERESERFCDVSIFVRGERFRAHRLVLAAASPFFEALFKSGNPAREDVGIGCQDPGAFQAFLNYLYTGRIGLKRDNVLELLSLSHRFLVPNLKTYCGAYLRRTMGLDNCLHVMRLSEEFEVPGLRKAATEFAQSHLEDLINHESVMKLDQKELEGFVMDKAYALPQDAVAKLMSHWVAYELPGRERAYKELLGLIDWKKMDPWLMLEILDLEILFDQSERSLYTVLRSIREQGIIVYKYELIYQALYPKFGQVKQEAELPGLGDNVVDLVFHPATEEVPGLRCIKTESDNESSFTVKDPTGKSKRTQSNQKLFKIGQRRRKLLANVSRRQGAQSWVRLTLGGSRRGRKRRLITNSREVSSGEEEGGSIGMAAGFRCHLCRFVTKKVSRLENHISGIHGHDLTYRCPECDYSCQWNRDYFLHMHSHYGGPPFKCDRCEYKCREIGPLLLHKRRHFEQKQCGDCDYKCGNKATLAAHLKSQHTDKEKPSLCELCGIYFASKDLLDEHMVDHHSGKMFLCSDCSFTTKYLKAIKSHMKTHSALSTSTTVLEKKEKCEICGKTFRSKDLLEKHMVDHNCKENSFACGVCVFKTKDYKTFMSHLKSHEVLILPQLSAEVTTNRPTPIRMKTKFGVVFKCPGPKCYYTAETEAKVVNHMRLHDANRRYACMSCGWRFLVPSKLVRHQKTHRRAFKCEDSTHSTAQAEGLRQHKARSNGGVVYAKKSTKKKLVSIRASSNSGAPSQQSTKNDPRPTTASDAELIDWAPEAGSAFINLNSLAEAEAEIIAIERELIAGAAPIEQLNQFQGEQPTAMEVDDTLEFGPLIGSCEELQQVLEDLGISDGELPNLSGELF